jgi:hypothetical protein
LQLLAHSNKSLLGKGERPFKAGHGVSQGGPLSAKLFNIVVDAVVRERMRLMRKMLDDMESNLANPALQASLPSFTSMMAT